MRAGEERDREAHILGGGGHHETRRRHVGFDCIHPPTQLAEAILDRGQASVSPPCACILSQEQFVVRPRVRFFLGFCVRKCLPV